MNGQIQYASASRVTLRLSPADQEVTYFTAPVRCGRRRHDEVGHLEVTSRRLRFHGTLDVNVAWDDVESVEGVGREMVVHVIDRRRQFRFCFHTPEEAGQGLATARQLTSGAATAV